MAADSSKPLSGMMKLMGWLLLALVIAGSIALGLWLSGGLASKPSPAPGQGASPFLALLLSVVIGGFCLFAGVVAYAAILGTRCLTFDFSRPVWKTGCTSRLWLANVAVQLLVLIGAGFVANFVVGAVLLLAGVPTSGASLLAFFGVLIAGQFLFIWLDIWKPVGQSLVRRRLAALGVPAEDLKTGFCTGISDPTVSSLKKFTLIEDDVGLLWLRSEALVYRGDAQSLVIPRERLLAIERRVDKGSMAAYSGCVHVILRYRDDAGAEKQVRLHVETCWTLTGRARALDQLAADLQAWLASASSRSLA